MSHFTSVKCELTNEDAIIEALKRTGGNQTRAAQELDTSLRIINYKIHQYEIDPKKFKIKK